MIKAPIRFAFDCVSKMPSLKIIKDDYGTFNFMVEKEKSVDV